MIAMRILCLLFCGCFVIVNSQSTVDETSSQCLLNNDEYVLHTVERTCKPTQQLLHRHEQLLNQVSAQLMTCKDSQSTGMGMEPKKQHLVSSLTGRSRSLVILASGRIGVNAAGLSIHRVS